MAIEALTDVAIVGAGVAGLSLAIYLQSIGLKPTIYESQPENTETNYTNLWTLTPNGLRSAEALGILPELEKVGVSCENITVLNGAQELLSKREVGSAARHGHSALSISQSLLVKALTARALAAGILINYNHTFASVKSESKLTVAFTDGTSATHDLLVGADGMNSAVRAHIHPDYQTTYMGNVALAATAPRSTLVLPAEHTDSLPLSIADPRGHVMFSPIGKETISIAMAHAIPAPESGDWSSLRGDKALINSIFREKAAAWDSLVGNVVENLDQSSLSLWPMLSGPALTSWVADRVVLIGDAAHVLPPVGMLGGNLALEDALSLGVTLGRIGASGAEGVKAGLEHWQGKRMARLERVSEVSRSFGKMSKAPAAATAAVTKPDNGWLYDFDAVKDLEV